MSDFSSYGGPSEEWLAVQARLPGPKPGVSVVDLKDGANRERERLAGEAMKTLAAEVKTRDHSIPARDGAALDGRTYRPISEEDKRPLPVYIHLHGGGFVFGTLASEDAICSRIAISANVMVLNVNYRHTPEITYPTPWHDAQDAFVWLHQNIQELGGDPAQVVMGGISAGAQITASVVLQQHMHKTTVLSSCPPIAGQVLMIPCLVNVDCYQPQLDKLRDPSASSYAENKDAPILPESRAREFVDLLKIVNPDPADLELNPGNARPDQVRGLPPTVLGVCGLDLLRDEGLLYGKLLTGAGVATQTNLFRGVPHGFRRFGDQLSTSTHWDRVMHGGIRWVLSNPKPAAEFIINDI